MGCADADAKVMVDPFHWLGWLVSCARDVFRWKMEPGLGAPLTTTHFLFHIHKGTGERIPTLFELLANIYFREVIR